MSNITRVKKLEWFREFGDKPYKFGYQVKIKGSNKWHTPFDSKTMEPIMFFTAAERDAAIEDIRGETGDTA